MSETLEATFERLKNAFGIDLDPSVSNLRKLQNSSILLNGNEDAIAEMLRPDLLKYNESWSEVEAMLDKITSKRFREKHKDDFGRGWIYSWHIMDHIGYLSNPRRKMIGLGAIFEYYRNYLSKLEENKFDELNWHYHPKPIVQNDLAAATSYVNSTPDLYNILCDRLIRFNWFPRVNRPGFHVERPDIHLFLEQWIPFDYANQYYEYEEGQPDFKNGRFGDWRFASSSWRGYHPAHNDYQAKGSCRRMIFRCLNMGSRLRLLRKEHVEQAFNEAEETGAAILAFSNHDYRDMSSDVEVVHEMVSSAKSRYSDVLVLNSSAAQAAIALQQQSDSSPVEFSLTLKENILVVKLNSGELFGAQPFLAIKDRTDCYYHDNFDIHEYKSSWSYVFDEQTIRLDRVAEIAVAANSVDGSQCIKRIKL
ncbi:hypothetical protein QWJ17_00195 [Betaproteobacteria bacterium LSUCC0117]|nr:hypothetical protein [Betaproteobacteria bacterium LSUCC0117]